MPSFICTETAETGSFFSLIILPESFRVCELAAKNEEIIKCRMTKIDGAVEINFEKMHGVFSSPPLPNCYVVYLKINLFGKMYCALVYCNDSSYLSM